MMNGNANAVVVCEQEKATKWYSGGEIDGLTTNGVLIVRPVGGFSQDSKAGVWREASVGGGIYALRDSRSTPQKNSLVSHHLSLSLSCGRSVLS